MRFVINGARGSIPVSGPEYDRHGGDTTCFSLVDGDETPALFDAGTGLRSALAALEPGSRVTIFVTHYHWDHIQGLSMIEQLWSRTASFHIVGPGDPRRALEGAIRPPWFPVALSEAGTHVTYEAADGSYDLGGVKVQPIPLHHPQGSLGFRIDGTTASVVIATDHEGGTDADEALIAAGKGADLLLHDAQYSPEELAAKAGWGHSSWEEAVTAAERMEAAKLLLTSHDPSRDDDAIDALVAAARRRFEPVEAAREGMSIEL